MAQKQKMKPCSTQTRIAKKYSVMQLWLLLSVKNLFSIADLWNTKTLLGCGARKIVVVWPRSVLAVSMIGSINLQTAPGRDEPAFALANQVKQRAATVPISQARFPRGLSSAALTSGPDRSAGKTTFPLAMQVRTFRKSSAAHIDLQLGHGSLPVPPTFTARRNAI